MLVNNVRVSEVEEPMTVTESEAVDVLEASLKCHSSDIATQSLSLIALLKLSSRFPPTSERIREIIIHHKVSVVLELQQRAIEFNSIIQRHQNIKSSLLERMPVLDESTYIGKRAGSSPTNVSVGKTSQSTILGTSLKLPNGIAHVPATPVVDLLDLSSDDNSVTTSSSNDFLHDLLGIGLTNPSSTGTTPKAGTDVLMDLLSIGEPNGQKDISVSEAVSSNQEIAQATKPFSSTAEVMDLLDGAPTNTCIPEYGNPVYPSIIAFQSSTLKITFTFTKQIDKPQVTQIQATFTNLSLDAYTDFIFQAAVPKFIQMNLDPASSNLLPANSNGTITQTLTVTNTQHGQKSLAMRMRMAYKVNHQEKIEQGQLNDFPRGL